ncbi:Fimbrial protein [Photorhabdus australis subsp. thailandensis]|uniref:Fimbrial protein n=1 Tax=Photorhabdus australis subsp. thailandensis TaxID=2805096 RepID=A0A1C0U8H2_9GAMM|nr:type 1 fimbrial protein [Photorhabdus australis]OCQ54176.1 Fimbrial protein [Photorhabdus australis subsp. thailandensis]
MKKILKISVVAALVMGAASAALAAGEETDAGRVGKNTMVTITGNVVAATCDVTSPNANGKVDLGNASENAFKPSTFTDQKGIVSYAKEASRPITIALSNCDDKNTEAGKVQLHVTGPVLGGSNNVIFNNSGDGKNVGAILTYESGSGTDKKQVVVSNNSNVPLGATGTEFNGQSITFTAYMASTILKPGSNQHVDAPITFSYAYN